MLVIIKIENLIENKIIKNLHYLYLMPRKNTNINYEFILKLLQSKWALRDELTMESYNDIKVEIGFYGFCRSQFKSGQIEYDKFKWKQSNKNVLVEVMLDNKLYEVAIFLYFSSIKEIKPNFKMWILSVKKINHNLHTKFISTFVLIQQSGCGDIINLPQSHLTFKLIPSPDPIPELNNNYSNYDTLTNIQVVDIIKKSWKLLYKTLINETYPILAITGFYGYSNDIIECFNLPFSNSFCTKNKELTIKMVLDGYFYTIDLNCISGFVKEFECKYWLCHIYKVIGNNEIFTASFVWCENGIELLPFVE